MRGMTLAATVLAAGALVLGSGVAFAAGSTTPNPAAPQTPAVSPQKTMGPRAEGPEAGRTEAAADRAYDGVVTHVETAAHPHTLVMNTKLGAQVLTVGVDVLPSTKITESGATKTLADIHKGDRIWMQWDRTGNHLIADQIRIL